MALPYLLVIILLQIAGYDTVGGEAVQIQLLIGILFASVSGIIRIWRIISR